MTGKAHCFMCNVSLIIWLIFHQLSIIDCAKPESDLYAHLMANYDSLERPVKNSSAPVTITLGVTLQQIIDVDEKNQIVKINAWLKYGWVDYKLNWKPEEFGGVGDVRFPKGKLWMPDVLLYNSVDSSFDSSYPTNLIVYSDGSITWIPPGIFQISCKIDITWFPFDEQRCYFKFGSWTYDGTKLDLQGDVNGMDMSEYLVNGEWNLYETKVDRNEKFYECCPEPYPSLYFTMFMKRRTLYYGFNLIIPCILITLMTILGFTLPPDAGEKIGLRLSLCLAQSIKPFCNNFSNEITVLLSICFFLSIVSEMSPPTSEAVPLLGTFFSTCMFVVSASVVLTVAVLNFHHRTPDMHEMGDFTRAVFLFWVPWLMAMNRPGQNITRADLPNPFRPHWRKLAEDAESTKSTSDSQQERQEAELEQRINQCFRALADNKKCMDTGQQAMLMIMHRIYVELKFVTKRMAEEDEAGEKQNEWKFAAMAIDRLCLVLFTLFISGSTCYIFFTAPYLTA